MHSAESKRDYHENRGTSVVRNSKKLHQIGFGHFQWYPPAKEQVKNNFINMLQKYEEDDTWKLAVLNIPLQNLHNMILKKIWRYFFPEPKQL